MDPYPYRRASVAGMPEEEPPPRAPGQIQRHPSMPALPSHPDPPARLLLPPPPVPPHRHPAGYQEPRLAPAPPRLLIPQPSLCACQSNPCREDVAVLSCPKMCSDRKFCILGLVSHWLKRHSDLSQEDFRCPKCGFRGDQRSFITHAYFSPTKCQLFSKEMTQFLLMMNFGKSYGVDGNQVNKVLMDSMTNFFHQTYSYPSPASPIPETEEDEEFLICHKRRFWRETRQKQEAEKFLRDHGQVVNLLAREGVQMEAEEENEVEMSPIFDPNCCWDHQPMLEDTEETMEPTSPVGNLWEDEETPQSPAEEPKESRVTVQSIARNFKAKVTPQLPLPIVPGPRNTENLANRPLPPTPQPVADIQSGMCADDPRRQGKTYQNIVPVRQESQNGQAAPLRVEIPRSESVHQNQMAGGHNDGSSHAKDFYWSPIPPPPVPPACSSYSPPSGHQAPVDRRMSLTGRLQDELPADQWTSSWRQKPPQSSLPVMENHSTPGQHPSSSSSTGQYDDYQDVIRRELLADQKSWAQNPAPVMENSPPYGSHAYDDRTAPVYRRLSSAELPMDQWTSSWRQNPPQPSLSVADSHSTPGRRPAQLSSTGRHDVAARNELGQTSSWRQNPSQSRVPVGNADVYNGGVSRAVGANASRAVKGPRTPPLPVSDQSTFGFSSVSTTFHRSVDQAPFQPGALSVDYNPVGFSDAFLLQDSRNDRNPASAPVSMASNVSQSSPDSTDLRQAPAREITPLSLSRLPANVEYPDEKKTPPTRPPSPEFDFSTLRSFHFAPHSVEPHFSNRGWEKINATKEAQLETGVTLHLHAKELPVKKPELFEENAKNDGQHGVEKNGGEGEPPAKRPLIGPVQPFQSKLPKRKVKAPPSPKFSPPRRRRSSRSRSRRSRSRGVSRHRSRAPRWSPSPRRHKSRHSSRDGRRSRGRRSRSRRSHTRHSRPCSRSCRRSRSRGDRSSSYRRTRSPSRCSRYGSTPPRDRYRRSPSSPPRHRRRRSPGSRRQSSAAVDKKQEEQGTQTTTGGNGTDSGSEVNTAKSEKESGSPKSDGAVDGEAPGETTYQRLYKITSSLFAPLRVPEPVPLHYRVIEPAPVQPAPKPTVDEKILKKVKQLKENNIHKICEYLKKRVAAEQAEQVEPDVKVPEPPREREDTSDPNWSCFGKRF